MGNMICTWLLHQHFVNRRLDLCDHGWPGPTCFLEQSSLVDGANLIEHDHALFALKRERHAQE